MNYVISAIVFLFIAVVLVFTPSQLFSRHDPIMVRLFNSAAWYKNTLKYCGYLLFVTAAILLLVGVTKILA